uniref:ABC transporter domain-containing protein n=1 Tax=Oryza brachyantha TaxID=4533 RepID=J3NE90_ORYBR
MACLLKDGFVSYLRGFATITPPIPKQIVKFCGITYSAKIETSTFRYETFGNKLLEWFVQPVRSLSMGQRSTELHILKGIDGYIMPGSMTLLLGPPGSGKSTLLKILAGRIDPGKDHGLTGMALYNDKTAYEVQKSRLIAYVCGQLNKHIPFLSVRETLEFARDCTQGLQPENFTPQMRKFFAYALVEGQDPFLEYVLQILDLKKIENHLVSTISKTDRDKLTTAELALGTYSVILYDQPLASSDASMTYGLVNTIRTIIRIQQSSAVMTLNYLSQQTFDLFDRVTLLGEGHVLYQGPRQDAVTYFAQQGYMKPPHVESWEFLQDIAAENSMQYLVPRSTQRSLEELVECYYSSDHYQDILRVIGMSKELSTYWVESEPGIGLSLRKITTINSDASPDDHQEMEVVVAKLLNKPGTSSGVESTGNIQIGDVINENEPQWVQLKKPYVQPWWTSTRTLIQRQLRILKHLYILGTLRLFQALLYSACVYFLAGLTMENDGKVFFEYLFLMFLVAYFGSSIFFFLSAVSSIPEVANALAGLVVSIFLLFSGFVIYPYNIPHYWKWLMHINPIRWANLSFCDQQFSNGYKESCKEYPEQLNFCKGYRHMVVGKAYLIYAELLTNVSKYHLVPYAIIIGWILFVQLLALMSLNKIEFSEMSHYVPSINKRKLSKNYLYDLETYESSCDDYLEGSIESGRYEFLGLPKLASKTAKIMSEDGSDGSWMEESGVETQPAHLSIPVMPVTLTFMDLSFSRCRKGEKEESLDFQNVTGYAKPGALLAIVGGNNGSTSTLLKCLAGRPPPDGNIIGDLQVNGTRPSTDFTRRVGYVEQLDAHQPYLTICESIQFSASLRLVNGVTKARRQHHVETVLDQLGLRYYANHLVGSLRDGTVKTFEVAKKLTIAVELAANPSILFLEDPLSGLDSSGTSAIMNVFSRLIVSRQTVIATVSYPNARALSYFHQVIILTQDGDQAYFGPVGVNCNEILGYFTEIPRLPPYIQAQNPVSFIMGVIGIGIPRKKVAVADIVGEFQNSYLLEIAKGTITRVTTAENESRKHNNMITGNYNYSASPIRQLGLVLLRTQRFLWRNVHYTYSRFTGCVMVGLLMGSLYFKIKYEDTYGVTSRSLYIYMQTILIGVISANNVVPQIGTDRLAYFREMRSKMYHPILYPLSWVVSEVPYFLVATLAFAGIGNGMAGIGTQTATEFIAYWSVLFLFTLCMTYFGMMVTFLAPSPILAAFLVSIITSMWVSASGVVVVFSDIRFYKWMYWTNPFQYAMNTLTTISFYCDTSQCQTCCSCPRLPDGTYVWDRIAIIRSLNQERVCADVMTLAGMCTMFATLAFLFFIVLKHNLPQTH